MKLCKFASDKEPPLSAASFFVHKFNSKPFPSQQNTLIVCSFSEFGCEILTVLYCLPRIRKQYPDKYIIVAGWFGRKYLYQHLVDEFWELKEEYQYLRDSTYAFHHKSNSLKKIEKTLSNIAPTMFSTILGNEVIGARCKECKFCWPSMTPAFICVNCQSKKIEQSLFSNIAQNKKKRVDLPLPSQAAIENVARYVKPNMVGIFARGRKTYGRNLSPEFYINLIDNLENRGYNPIWLGEKQSTLACPVKHIPDFSRNPESRDLELTLAIVSKCLFTVQFWTASTRLASLVKTPYLLFESPNQIEGNGHEGKRLELTDTVNNKLVLTNYISFAEDLNIGQVLVNQALDEIKANNWNRIIK